MARILLRTNRTQGWMINTYQCSWWLDMGKGSIVWLCGWRLIEPKGTPD